jgi:hypothetical protein
MTYELITKGDECIILPAEIADPKNLSLEKAISSAKDCSTVRFHSLNTSVKYLPCIELKWNSLVCYDSYNVEFLLWALKNTSFLQYVYIGFENFDLNRATFGEGWKKFMKMIKKKMNNNYSIFCVEFELDVNEFYEPFFNETKKQIDKYTGRNEKGYIKCESAIITLLLVLKKMRIQKDVAQMLGKYVWETRGTKIWCK